MNNKEKERLDLRDRLAAAALSGIMSNPVRWQQIKEQYEAGETTYDEASMKNARKAYSLADAMLEARKEDAKNSRR